MHYFIFIKWVEFTVGIFKWSGIFDYPIYIIIYIYIFFFFYKFRIGTALCLLHEKQYLILIKNGIAIFYEITFFTMLNHKTTDIF